MVPRQLEFNEPRSPIHDHAGTIYPAAARLSPTHPLPETRFEFLSSLCVYFICVGSPEEALRVLSTYRRKVEHSIPRPVLYLILDTHRAIATGNAFLFERIFAASGPLARQVLLFVGMKRLRTAALVNLSAAYRSLPMSFALSSLCFSDPFEPSDANAHYTKGMRGLLEEAAKKGTAAALCTTALQELDAQISKIEISSGGGGKDVDAAHAKSISVDRLSIVFRK